MMILIQPPRRETGVRPGSARRRWLVLAAGLALATAGQAGAAEEVVLRLKWWHQFQFAGYYAAQAKGYYEEEGLAVRIDQGRAGSPSVAAVLAGEAQFGVSDSDVVRAYLNGDPVVVCAAIFQHSPYVIMSRRDRGISKPSDLVGARVMLSDEQGAAQLKGMMVREGIDPERAVIVPHSWRLDDLIEGRVDAISAYATVEPALMRAAGVEPHLLRSSDYGVDFYGDVLFTSREQAARHPERTAAFVRASLRGWEYALRHPEEMADLILGMEGVRERGVTRGELLAEAREMMPFIQPEFVGIGHMNPGRWRRIAETFVEFGLARAGELDGFVFDPATAGRSPGLPAWVRRGLLGAAAVCLGVLLWNLQMRRRVTERTRQLAEEAERRARVEADLRVSEKRFRMMFKGAASGIAVLDPEGRFVRANPSYCTTIGYTEGELRGRSVQEVAHPEDWPGLGERVANLLKGGSNHFRTEVRCLAKSGRCIWKRVSVSLVRTEDGAPGSIIVVAEDVSARREAERELARVNRAQRMLGACGDALVRAESEQELLEAICRVAVEIGGYRMAWVGFAEQDAKRTIRPVAHAGCEEGYLSEIELSWDEASEAGRGPAGRTVREGVAVVCADIEADERFSRWRGTALGHGYRGVICLPLHEGATTRGVLGLHAGEVIAVGADEVGLLQQLTDDLAFGIEALRTREERRKTLEAVLTVSRGVSMAIGAAFFDRLTESMVAAVGGDVGVIGRIDPENPGEVRTLSVVADGRRLENVSYKLEGGPCGTISADECCVVPHGVQERFPLCELLVTFGAQAYVGHPLLNADGRMTGLMAVLFRRPIGRAEFILSTLRIFSSRAAAELDRQQVDARVREQAALLDKAQDAIIVRDLDHRISYWNKSAERLYGWTAAEAVGRSIAELLYREPGEFREATRRTVERGEWAGELQQVTKAGVALTVECHWTLVRDEAGNPRSVFAINTDITEKKRIEHQLLRNQRLESIGTLAGGIAHDLNNVLSPIIMASELLDLEERDARKRALLASIGSSARRAADMVGQVLAFARGMDGNRVPVDPGRIVGDVEKIARDTFPKNIVIRVSADSDLRPVVGDATQIHQVLLNLCVNARDAMPEGGDLTLTVANVEIDAGTAAMHPGARPGPHVCIEVKDTGTGMSPATLEKIFDPFFTTKEVGKGTGLGLPTSLAIAKGHGGFLRVDSEVGHGTRFTVCLPAGDTTAAGEEAVAVDIPRGRGETVLVVDDEASIRGLVRKILEDFGYRAIPAADGAEAIALYRERAGEIAVVITDMMMPVLDGVSTIRGLREVNPRVRIIAASGIAADGRIARAEALGVRHFLPKPFSATTLLRVVRDALE